MAAIGYNWQDIWQDVWQDVWTDEAPVDPTPLMDVEVLVEVNRTVAAGARVRQTISKEVVLNDDWE